MIRRRVRNERGAAVLEFAVVFPVVFVVLITALSMFWMLAARSALSGAARDGARFASIRAGALEPYPTSAEVEAYVRDRVGPFGVDEVVVVPATQPNGPVSVTVRRDLPVLVGTVADLFGDDELVFESTAAVRAE